MKIGQILYVVEVLLLNVSKVLWPPQWRDVTRARARACLCMYVYIYIYIYIYKTNVHARITDHFINGTVIGIRSLAMCYGSMPKLFLKSHKKRWG